MTVGVAVLEAKPVDRTSEYVATLRSRQTSDIRPAGGGHRHAHPGPLGPSRRRRTPLAQVDPLKQEASVSSDEATRARRKRSCAWPARSCNGRRPSSSRAS